VSIISITEIRQVLMGSLHARIISLRDDVPLIAHHAIVDLAMAQAEAQDTGLMLNTIPRAPRPPGQQIAIADLPSGIGPQHGILILSLGVPLGFGTLVVRPAEPKPLSLPPDCLITALGEAGLRRRVGWGVVTANLVQIAHKLASRPAHQAAKAT
jgi:hypothetical protein